MGGACCTDIQQASTVDQTPAKAPSQPALDPTGPAVPVSAAVDGQLQAGGDGDPGADQFVSQVGPLPVFDKGRPTDEDDCSQISSNQASVMADGLTAKEQKQQAKGIVKDFVKEMVKGKKMNVMTQNGQLKQCTVSLARGLDCLKIKAGGQTRSIELKSVDEIHAGEEVEGVNTPVDELCATLMLASGDCITFRLPDINGRDTFVMCLLMFCNNQKT